MRSAGGLMTGTRTLSDQSSNSSFLNFTFSMYCQLSVLYCLNVLISDQTKLLQLVINTIAVLYFQFKTILFLYS